MNEVIERLIRLQEREAVIATNYDYINWLEDFTEKHPGFTTNSWLYEPKAISTEDLAKVDELNLFFNAVREAAKRNFIPVGNDTGEYLILSHNNIHYEIGYCYGQGAFFYAYRTVEAKNCLDFNLVINNVTTARVKKINDRLTDFEIYVSKMLDEGIPETAIEEKMASVLKLTKKHK